MATQPRTISQRIALIGSEEIAKKLEELGKSGEQAFKGIDAAVETSVRRLERLVSVVATVEQSFARIGQASRAFGQSVAQFGTAFAGFEQSVGRFVRNSALLLGGGGLLGGAAVGIGRFATGAVQATDALEENAQAAGLTAEQYTRLQFATESAGLKQTQFQQVMGRLNDQFLEARKAQDEFLRAAEDGGVARTDEEVQKLIKSVTNVNNIFERLGVNVSTRSGRTLEQAMLSVGDALRKLPSDVQRVQVGVDTLGNRAGPRAVQAFAQLRQILRETGQDLAALQAPPELRRIGVEASQSLDVLSRAASLARERLGLVFAGNVREAAAGLTRAIIANIGPLEEFAKTVEQRVASVIRDLIRLLNGDDAAIENRWIVEWRDAIVQFGVTVQRVFTGVVAPAFRGLMSLLDRAAEAINNVFGTNLTGGEVAILAILGRITGAFDLVVKGATLALAAVVAFFSGIRLGLTVLAGLAVIAGTPATIAAAFVAAAALIVSNWEAVKTVFKELGVDISAAERAWKAFEAATGGEQINSVAASIETVSKAITRFNESIALGEPFWRAFIQFLKDADPLIEGFIGLIERAVDAVSRLRQLRQLPTHDEAANLQVQADQINEEARQRARLSQETTAAAEVERQYAETKRETARATALSAQAATQAAQTTVQAARATTQATQASTQAAQAAEQEARRRVDARQAEQNALRDAARSAKALAPDLAQPFKTAGDEAAKLGQQTRNLPDLATPFKAFGDEAKAGADRAGQATRTLPPLFVEVGSAAQQAGQTAVAGLDPIVAKVQEITQAIQQVGQPSAAAAVPAAAGAAAPAAPTAVGGPFANLVTQAQQARDAILAIFQGLGAQIEAAISGVGVAVAAAPVATAAAGEAAAAPTAAGGPFAALVQQATQAAQQIQAVFSALGPSLTAIFSSAFQGLSGAVQAAISSIPGLVQSMVSAVQGAVQGMVTSVEQAVRQAIQSLQEVVRAAQDAAAAASRVGQGFASGGYTGAGPRSKVAGVVHAGEYVQPKWLVRRPGVLGFMEALRRTGDLQGTIERFVRGFDLGGMVPGVRVPQMAYASGGLAGRDLGTLTFADSRGQQIATVFTDRANAEALGRFAGSAARRSGGRKPARYS